MPMLEIRGLTIRYGGIEAVRDVNITVNEGDTALLVGANGAGKSSIIKAIIGLVRISAGSVAFCGREITRYDAPARAHAGIGYAPEGRRIFPTLTVEDNVLAGCYGRPAARRSETLRWLYDTFPLLEKRRSALAGQLSGGEQQVVALARAVSSVPKLLLLDEPFLGLAPIWISSISQAIRNLQERGVTIVMAEQMARPALKLASGGYILRSGEIRRSGAIAEISASAIEDEYL